MEPYAFLQEAGEDLRGQLDRVEKRTWRLLAVCAAGSLLLFLLLSVSGMASPGLSALLVRPDPDGGKTEADVTLRLDYKGASHEEDIQVEIPPRERTRAETEALFDRCEAELREDVFAGGEVLRALRSGLQLPLASRDGSVAITWSSSDPARVSESGSVDLVGAQQGETVTLTAVLSAGEYARRLDFEASLSPDTVEDWEESLRQEAAALARELPGRLTDREQILPETSPSGAQAQWTLRKRALPWEIAGLCVFACAAILFSRTDALQRRLKKQKRALEQEIPNMTMQMILLLNAGLTVETAFTRLITENSGRDEPLYRSFSRLEAESKATNMPFVNLLYVYARQSGIRDLIRFASLALDCSGRGSELSEKLDRERLQLRSSRLHAAKAKAGEAETKLSLPLMVLLLVMVVIAVSPALLEL